MDTLIYKSIEQETPHCMLPVEGKLPHWLSGDLIRNGPAKFEVGNYQLNHWFDGYAMLHKFSIQNSRVSYQSRFLHSRDYLKSTAANYIKNRSWGTIADPCASIFSKFFSAFTKPEANNASVSILKNGNRIAAVSDFSSMVEFDYTTLETKGEIRFPDQFGNGYMFSAAHSSYDPETNEVFNCLGKPGPKGQLSFIRISESDFKRKPFAFLTLPRPTYFHSHALTKNYFIFIEQPLELNIWQLMFSQFLNRPYEACYHWKPKHGTKFHLVHRRTGKITTVNTSPFFFFHTVNAFEEGDEVMIDLCLYKDPTVIKDLYLDKLRQYGIRKESMAYLYRANINLSDKKVTLTKLSDISMDLPSFNRNKSCQPYHFVYGLGLKETGAVDVNNELVKTDLRSGETMTWYHKGLYPSEPVFVENPDGISEDDGVILSVILDTDKRTSFLLLLNACNFTEIARAYAPVHLPIGLHGMFYHNP
jgi:beta,beta-carotene 9',10'-dioxygenase